jgi:hypothetical protein
VHIRTPWSNVEGKGWLYWNCYELILRILGVGMRDLSAG